MAQKNSRTPLIVLICTLQILGVVAVLRMVAPQSTGNLSAPLTVARALSLTDLTMNSDLIVRGVVRATDSRWTDDRRLIVTDVTIDVLYTLMGEETAVLELTVEGGELEDEEIAMHSSIGQTFTPDEHLLLFLNNDTDGLHLTDYRDGKYVIAEAMIYNPVSGSTRSLAEMYTDLTGISSQIEIPADWEAIEEAAGATLAINAAGYVYNGFKWGGDYPEVEFYINVNSSQAGTEDGSVDEIRRAIVSAAETWTAVPTAAFSLRYAGATADTQLGYNGSNSIFFTTDLPENALGLARYWYSTSTRLIIEADMGINDTFDVDATGNPGGTEVDLESAVLHEFGHWISLGHDPDPDSVMSFQLLRGVLRRQLHANDVAGLSDTYPCGAPPCVPNWLQPTPTPTMTPQPTATPTLTPTPTPGNDIRPGETIPQTEDPGETIPPNDGDPDDDSDDGGGDGGLPNEDGGGGEALPANIYLPIIAQS